MNVGARILVIIILIILTLIMPLICDVPMIIIKLISVNLTMT